MKNAIEQKSACLNKPKDSLFNEMVDVGDLAPELGSFFIGLLLSLLGVPGPLDWAIQIGEKIQEAYPTPIGSLYIFIFRLLVWFGFFEFLLRIILLIISHTGSGSR